MTKTIHALLSHYSFTKWGKGGGRLFEGALILDFRPTGEALIRGNHFPLHTNSPKGPRDYRSIA